jgi:hypothetical protein
MTAVASRAAIAILLAALTAAAAAWAFFELSETPPSGLEQLRALAQTPPDYTPVATVNGRPITLRSLQVNRAFSRASLDVIDPKHRLPTAQRTVEYAIENELLVRAAERSGVTVSEEEITMTVKALFRGPLEEGTPAAIKTVVLAYLDALGIAPDAVEHDPGMRELGRHFVLLNRIAADSAKSREQLIAEERARSTIITYLKVIARIRP